MGKKGAHEWSLEEHPWRDSDSEGCPDGFDLSQSGAVSEIYQIEDVQR